jgi:hypothetical protein
MRKAAKGKTSKRRKGTRRARQPRRKTDALRKSEQLAAEIAMWQKRLAPKLPEIDPHDLHLILWSILRRKYGGERYFLLKRRPGGGYVF